MSWPEASQPPHSNVVGVDPELTDPENGDFRPAPGSPASGYGCRTFTSRGGDDLAAAVQVGETP
ncbi:MAG: hypothetical protein KAJ04_03175, partial [Candidatus Eisenbacteria sp.]|nr:hypothetical protein [Candidatus Eisenbacteria bacterium]